MAKYTPSDILEVLVKFLLVTQDREKWYVKRMKSNWYKAVEGKQLEKTFVRNKSFMQDFTVFEGSSSDEEDETYKDNSRRIRSFYGWEYKQTLYKISIN